MDFTTRQENDIDLFQGLVQDTVVACAMDQDRAGFAVDDPGFYGPLCEMIAEFCANHGVDIRYPVRITDGDEERIQECLDPTDMAEREHWARVIDDKILQSYEKEVCHGHEEVEDR